MGAVQCWFKVKAMTFLLRETFFCHTTLHFLTVEITYMWFYVEVKVKSSIERSRFIQCFELDLRMPNWTPSI